jgi:hypothetical protein
MFLMIPKNGPNGSKVVLQQMEPFSNKGYHVITVNWFSRSDLFYKLCSKKAAAMGTLHQIRKGVPVEINKK